MRAEQGAAFMERAWVTSAAYRSLIENLVAAREAAGVGQRELARRLGKPPSWLNKIERLERRLDLLEFIAIARALQIPPNELLVRISRSLPSDLTI
jgi:transcriptional regulator with XRE-family HTH domain